MENITEQPYSDADRLAEDALEELASINSYASEMIIGMALGKLQRYEETGLTPQEIAKLQKPNKGE